MDFVFDNNHDIIEWLKTTKLLKQQRICTGCQKPMKWSLKPNNQDGWVWRCGKCQKICTIREDSFFSQIRLTLFDIMKLLRHWALEYRSCDTSLVLNIARKTVIKYNQLFRQVVIND
jgi:hypothetical protein